MEANEPKPTAQTYSATLADGTTVPAVEMTLEDNAELQDLVRAACLFGMGGDGVSGDTQPASKEAWLAGHRAIEPLLVKYYPSLNVSGLKYSDRARVLVAQLNANSYAEVLGERERLGARASAAAAAGGPGNSVTRSDAPTG